MSSITIIIISEGINKRNQRQYSKLSDRDIFCERCRNRVGVYFIVQKLSLSQKLKTLAEHRKLFQKNPCFKVFKRKITEFCKQRRNSHLRLFKLIVQLLN